MKKIIFNNKRGMTPPPCHPRHSTLRPEPHRSDSKSAGGNLNRRCGLSRIFSSDKRGMTLVELIVSMGIFAVVMTMTVGFFITTQKMQMAYRDRANLQQEGRIASEIFSRYVREAKTVNMTNSTGTAVTDLSSGSGLCAGGSAGLMLTMLDNTRLQFTCLNSGSNTPNTLKMASCNPSATCTLPTPTDISSSQINIPSLTISRDTVTYPKTLKYYLQANQLKKDASGNIVTPGEGEKIMFPGYLVMRNEL